MKDKKAQVQIGITLIMGLFVLALIMFGLAYAGSSMKTAIGTSNATKPAAYVIGNMTVGMGNLASLSPVLWIFAGIVILVGMALLIYRFVQRKQ